MSTKSLILSFSLTALSGQLAVVDVSLVPGSTPPEPYLVSYSPAPQLATDADPVRPTLTLRLVKANDANNQRRGILDLRIENLGSDSVLVPISRDGKKAYEICGKGSLFKSATARKSALAGNWQTGAELYGCPDFRGSTVTLMKGDWITIAGVSFATNSIKDGSDGTITYSVTEEQYHSVGGKLSAISKGLYYIKCAAV